MQLTTFTDYSLRILLFAGARDRRCTVDEVAAAFDISRHHVAKAVNELDRLGYLRAYRGRSGGFTLGREAVAINIGDVVRATEESLAIVECFDRERNTCSLRPACGLKTALTEALDAFLSVLDRYTLADFLGKDRWHARIVALIPRGVVRRA